MSISWSTNLENGGSSAFRYLWWMTPTNWYNRISNHQSHTHCKTLWCRQDIVFHPQMMEWHGSIWGYQQGQRNCTCLPGSLIQILLCQERNAPSLMVDPAAWTSVPRENPVFMLGSPWIQVQHKQHLHGKWPECMHSRMVGYRTYLYESIAWCPSDQSAG